MGKFIRMDKIHSFFDTIIIQTFVGYVIIILIGGCMANKKATIEAMFEEIKDSLDNFENNSSKRLSDYK